MKIMVVNHARDNKGTYSGQFADEEAYLNELVGYRLQFEGYTYD
jgi:hypothetical protein